MDSPLPCPPTVTVRRNPHRSARPTPIRDAPSSPLLPRDIFQELPPVSVRKIKTRDTGPAPGTTTTTTTTLVENIKVYLRVRPVMLEKKSRGASDARSVWPKNQKSKVVAIPKTNITPEICVHVNEDMRSVTVSAPRALQEAKRSKSEVYEGFSHVFAPEASQSDVYKMMVKSVVDDFIKGKSGLLAAMGASGSGKTHTVFGSARDPGIVFLALRHIFSDNDSAGAQSSRDRVLCVSMWEIASEKGKFEKIIDLLNDDQHSQLKGVKEVSVSNAQQAESLIAQGMLKRATATTKSNSQSSRSQCIINIQYGTENEDKANRTTLTIADLAGAEREKKTGNLGARLLESNFINNTSMVFGLCLRSLLEHQKNPNRPLPKHYKNSLLTRYLQDYLEGKKKMTLILTVKSGVEDYPDTSFLLRQASPLMQIKFETIEDQSNLNFSKRHNDDWPKAMQHKKMKFNKNVVSKIDVSVADVGSQKNGSKPVHKGTLGKELKDDHAQPIKSFIDGHSNPIHVQTREFVRPASQEEPSSEICFQKHSAEKDREFKIMVGLSKAFWKILKEFKMKLQDLEIEICHLRETSAKEYDARQDLQNKLLDEQLLRADLEKELKNLKLCCKCRQEKPSDFSSIPSTDACSNRHSHEMDEYLEEGVGLLHLLAGGQTEEEKGNVVNLAGHDLAVADDNAELIQTTCEPRKSIEMGVCRHSKPSDCSDGPASSDSYVDSIKEGVASETEPGYPVSYPSVCTSEECVSLGFESEVVSTRSNLVSSPTIASPNASLCSKDQTNSSEEFMLPECSQSDDCDSHQEDPSSSIIAHSDAANSSCDFRCDQDKFHNDDQRHLHPPIVALPVDGRHPEDALTSSVPNTNMNRLPQSRPLQPVTLPPEDKDDAVISSPLPSNTFQHKDKPKRRLLPAASMLVRDVAIFDIRDVNDKPKMKVSRRRERLTAQDNDENHPQSGSLPLINMLKKLQL